MQDDPFNLLVTADTTCPTCKGTGQVAQWSVDGITYRLAEPLMRVLFPMKGPVKILNCTCVRFSPLITSIREN